MEVELQPGDCLAGRYVILEEIGRGGFGIVYRAVQEGVNRHVALKTIRTQKIDIQNFDLVEAFRREALLTSKLKHPNTITLFDYGETEDETLYLVTEFLDGETLYERLWRVKTMTSQMVVQMSKQVAKSLGEAHAHGIIHGDLKPANIFLCQMYGERDYIKVLDFGIAKIIGEVDPAGLGTPEYMSPEQFDGEPLLAASDIYSLGLILYESLVGKRPFDAKDTGLLAKMHTTEPLPELPPAVRDTELGEIIRRATHKDPKARYENGMALFHALNNIRDVPHEAAQPIPLQSADHAPMRFKAAPSSKFSQALSRPVSSGFGGSGIHFNDQLAASEQDATLPLIGLEYERHRLHEHLTAMCHDEQGKIILLGGSAGRGKSRLARWLLRVATPPHPQALSGYGACQQGSRTPLQSVAEALSDALGAPRGDFNATTQACQRLLGRPLHHIEARAMQVLHDESTESRLDDPRHVVELLETVASVRPTVLVLDNIRWARKATFAVLKVLAEHLDQHEVRLLVVVNLRREALREMDTLADRVAALHQHTASVEAMSLKPLGDHDLSDIAHQLMGDLLPDLAGKPGVRLTNTLIRQSLGNPLYLRLLIQHLKEHDGLDSNGRTIQLSPDINIQEVIPEKMRRYLNRTLDKSLESHPKRDTLLKILTRCSLLGTTTTQTMLQSLLKAEARSGETSARRTLTRLRDHLAELTQLDLLEQRETLDDNGLRHRTLALSQPLLRHVLMRHLADSPQQNVALHQIAAQVKRRHYEACGDLDAHLEEIGEHHALAGEATSAVTSFVEAANHVGLQGHLLQAAELLERCRTIQATHESNVKERLRVLVALSWLKLNLGALAEFEALQVLGVRLAQDCQDEEAALEMDLQAGYMALHAGQLSQADRLLHQAFKGFEHQMTTPRPVPEAVRRRDLTAHWLSMESLPPIIGMATALWLRATVQRQMSHPINADAYLAEAGRLFKAAQHHWGQSMCLRELAALTLERGHPQQAEIFLERAEEHIQATSQALPASNIVMLRAQLYERLGKLEEARALLVDTITSLHNTRPSIVARCHARIGSIVATMGHHDEARDAFEMALAISQRPGTQLIHLQNLLDATAFLLERRAFTQATRLLQEATSLIRSTLARRHLPALQRLQGTLEAHCGRIKRARQWLKFSLKFSERAGDFPNAIQAHAQIARLVESETSQEQFQNSLAHLKVGLRRARKRQILTEALLRAQEAIAYAYQQRRKDNHAQELLHAAFQGWELLGNDNETARLTQEALIKPRQRQSSQPLSGRTHGPGATDL